MSQNLAQHVQALAQANNYRLTIALHAPQKTNADNGQLLSYDDGDDTIKIWVVG